MDCLYIDSVFDIYRPTYIIGPIKKNWLCLRKLKHFFRLKCILGKQSEMQSLRPGWIHVFQRRLLSSLLVLLRTSLVHLNKGGQEVVSWYLPRSSFFLCPTPEFRLLMRSFFLHPRQHAKAHLSLAVQPCSLFYSLRLLLLVKAQIQVQLIQVQLFRRQLVQWVVKAMWTTGL